VQLTPPPPPPPPPPIKINTTNTNNKNNNNNNNNTKHQKKHCKVTTSVANLLRVACYIRSLSNTTYKTRDGHARGVLLSILGTLNSK